MPRINFHLRFPDRPGFPEDSWSYRVGALVCLVLSLNCSDAQTVSFQKLLELPAPAPQCVLVADINRDGKKDILAGGGHELSVFLGDGKGGFIPAKGSPFPAGPSPNDLAMGDFNKDGRPDVAIANHGEKLLTVLLGDGSGVFSFALGSPFPVASNPHPHGLAAADFNGDGNLDLAVDSWGENKVLVLLGRGDGTFQTPGMKFDVGHSPYQRLRSADLNEDGHPDLVTSNWEGNSVTVLLGDGKGSFVRAGGRDISVPPSPFSVAIGDFNGDRHLDIAVGHYSGHATDPGKNGVSVLYGNGQGDFVLATGSPFPVGHYPATVVVGDIDADGVSDIAVPNAVDKTVTIYLGGKSGIHSPAGSPIPIGHDARCLAVADLNRDGKGDIVVGSFDDREVLVLLQR